MMKHQKKSHHLRRNKKFVALLFVVVLAAGLVCLAITKLQDHEAYKPSYIQALNVKGSASDASYIDKVSSTYKFSVSYDKRKFAPVAYELPGNGEFYASTGKDALVKKDYAMVVLYDKGAAKNDKAPLLGISDAELQILTNINDDFFDRRSAEYGQGLSQIELVEKHYEPKNNEQYKITKLNTKQVNIAGYDYRLTTYRGNGNSKYLPLTKITELYQTIIDNKPYVIKLIYTQGKDQEFVGSLRSQVASINYGDKATKQSASKADSATKSANSVIKSDNNVPTTLKDNTALRVAARNQPATVRVGVIYCTDVTLTNANKIDYLRIDKACTGGSGSGSIVTADGHISTNGHVSRLKPADAIIMGLVEQAKKGDKTPINKYLTYLYANGFMSKTQLDAMINGIKNDDPQALNEFLYSAELIPRNRIKINSENYSYAIQLSNEPIRYHEDNGQLKFKFTKNVVEAKYIDSNYDPYSGSQGTHNLTDSNSSDVAILKILKGDNFPVIQIGSVDNVKRGDLITAIGFPAFVDGGLDTKKSKTVPSITQGKVSAIIFDSPQKVRKLIRSDTPIAAGNSGGPAINNSGLQVGLNTYVLPSCGDGECFSVESFFRDVADYKKLLAKNKISAGGSKLSEQWLSALSAFENGEYGDSRVKFQTAKAAYPQLYLADNFIVEADKVIKSQQAQRNLIILIAVGLVILIVSLFFIIKAYLHHRKNHVNYQQPPITNPAGSLSFSNPGQQPYPAQPQYPTVASPQPLQPQQAVQQLGAPMQQSAEPLQQLQPTTPYQNPAGVQGQANVPGSTVHPSQHPNMTPANQPYVNPQNPPQQ